MVRWMSLLLCIITVLASLASADVVEHTFHVGNLTVQPLCEEVNIVAVNGTLPGPTIDVREGDQLVVDVINESPYNMTIHWHGIFQLLTGWADGPAYVTQCPMLPGNTYTYRFNVTMQEGTLWWHSHITWLRATVYGALIIRPRAGRSYPHITPHREFPIMLGTLSLSLSLSEHGLKLTYRRAGEWWNDEVIDVATLADAYTINGRPGDLYECANNNTYKQEVEQGKTYMLRVINAALNTQLFFKLAGHNLTVVAIDASYTEPYDTDFIVIAPGQTTDVLFTANASPGAYYMAAHPYITTDLEFTNTSTTGVIQYAGAESSSPQMPLLPPYEDTASAHRFYSNLTALRNFSRLPILYGGSKRVPLQMDERMFITIGLGLAPGPDGGALQIAASMNNESFRLPRALSLLEAHYGGKEGIYTDDFPDTPPVVFDYTNRSNISEELVATVKSTKVKRLRFNSRVEIVFQNTAIMGIANHPMHLHGYDFYVLAQGFGNYDRATAESMFNLVNPQVRNTIAVPTGGWAVIRFRANNPGVWMMHCHLDVHMDWGMSMAFVVDDGPTPSTTLPAPPSDLPRC
ncbi:hypothetical protein ACLOJK_030170 [Asimina triloba]